MKKWNIAIARDTAVPCLGLHGLHVASCGLANVEVSGFFDAKADDLDEIMAVTGAKKHYLNYVKMLDAEKPDIVILCSRHPYDHFPQIKEAASRGIHIYCEKPMTVSLQEADEIIALAEKNNIKICMAHPARYCADFLQMKNMINEGIIGKPLTIHGRGKNDHRGGGEDMMVLGTHILDLQTFFFGKPQKVWAEVLYEGKPIRKNDTCDTVEPIGPTAGDDIFASFRFSDNIRGLFESRRGLVDLSVQNTQMGIAVTGTEGTLSMRFDDYKDASLMLSNLPSPPDCEAAFKKVEVTDKRSIPEAAPLDYSLKGRYTPEASMFLQSNRYALWDLMCSITEDRQPVSGMYNARLALEMIYGIYTSQIRNCSVSFPLTERKHPLQ